MCACVALLGGMALGHHGAAFAVAPAQLVGTASAARQTHSAMVSAPKVASVKAVRLGPRVMARARLVVTALAARLAKHAMVHVPKAVGVVRQQLH